MSKTFTGTRKLTKKLSKKNSKKNSKRMDDEMRDIIFSSENKQQYTNHQYHQPYQNQQKLQGNVDAIMVQNYIQADQQGNLIKPQNSLAQLLGGLAELSNINDLATNNHQHMNMETMQQMPSISMQQMPSIPMQQMSTIPMQQISTIPMTNQFEHMPQFSNTARNNINTLSNLYTNKQIVREDDISEVPMNENNTLKNLANLYQVPKI